jgi:hypothetical protein
MIAGWLTASTQSVAGGANGGFGSAAATPAAACTTRPGIEIGARPSSRATSLPVRIPSAAML